jgi:hypothetical protein
MIAAAAATSSRPRMIFGLSGFLFPIISLFLLAAFVAIPVRADTVDFTIITTKGWVRYTVGSNWSVLWMETKAPELQAAFRFQIQRIQASLTRQTSLLSRSKMIVERDRFRDKEMQ